MPVLSRGRPACLLGGGGDPRNHMWEVAESECVCEGIAKSEWNATRKKAVCEKRQGDNCHDGPCARRLREGCEKAKAGNT